MKKSFPMGLILGFAACVALIGVVGAMNGQPPLSPVQPLPEHDVSYPGTEALGSDEMRVVALGTGMPTIRPKQAVA